MLREGDKICFILILPSPLPTLVVCVFVLKIIPVTFTDTKYIICNTLTTPSRPIMHSLQFLATCMPKHDKPILQRVKMGILFRTKYASPLQFKCDSNAPIFSLIGHELSELREFCEMCPEMENFRPRAFGTANGCNLLHLFQELEFKSHGLAALTINATRLAKACRHSSNHWELACEHDMMLFLSPEQLTSKGFSLSSLENIIVCLQKVTKIHSNCHYFCNGTVTDDYSQEPNSITQLK